MRPRANNRAARRAWLRDANRICGDRWSISPARRAWYDSRSARQRAARQRDQWQGARRANGAIDRATCANGIHDGRNVWRG